MHANITPAGTVIGLTPELVSFITHPPTWRSERSRSPELMRKRLQKRSLPACEPQPNVGWGRPSRRLARGAVVERQTKVTKRRKELSAEPDLTTIDRALSGDRRAVKSLIDHITPVIQARVARALLKDPRGRSRGSVREEVADISQEVFAALFADEGRVLRTWDPEKGLSMQNFVGLVAHRQTLSILRTGKRNPYTEDPTLDTELDSYTPPTNELAEAVEARDVARAVFESMDAQLSPLGRRLFELIVLEEREVTEVAEEMGMGTAAIYAWRSRLGKLMRKEYEKIVSQTRHEQQISSVGGQL